ncbi:peptidase M13 [Bifidobacterium aemilianum]|uniref:Peptidase M13 n=1 Tax=Bifidobacterium aemilianum TaxID=2493120 RepID=A0A366K944_9BIFI|nr:M13-type metalloendopeptidase [Bifidobacterium aemilianum]RBP98260.1 peptidase M13 [Bifidobacterium aemilianum]
MDTSAISGLEPSSFSSVTRPNDDLFRYVNGPWIDTYSLPEDRSRYGSFDKLAEDAERQIREILEDENCPAPKSQALYRSYCDTEAIEAAGITPIKGDLDAIDAVSSKKDLVRLLGSLNPTGGPDIFAMDVDSDATNPDADLNVVYIAQGGLGLPDEAYYREDHYGPIREQYMHMVAKQLQLAGYGDMDETQDQARRFLDLETKIASHHWDNVTTRDMQKVNNPTNYQELIEEFGSFDIALWIQAWQEAYDATPTSTNQPLDLAQAFSRVNVMEPSFLTGLSGLWEQTDLEDLKLWSRVQTIIGWANLLSSDFDRTNFDFFGKVLSGVQVQRDRWKRGVSMVNGTCGEEVGREYVKRHFPQSSKDRMEQLVANLIDAYRVSISSSSWLGQATKAKALEKLSKFTPMIGYTDQWRDYSALDICPGASLVDNVRAASTFGAGYQLAKAGKPVNRGEWVMNPQTVNAYYDPTKNVIVFPAAILQPPFFNPLADDAANYGAIGTVIGHEIGHGFDDQGSQFDGDGKLKDWWTSEDKANFTNLTRALIDQYNQLTPVQLEQKYANDPELMPHVNGALTIGENIGDLSGVNISLKAYSLALDAAEGRDKDGLPLAVAQTLDQAPVIDGFTGLQRFFLSYASIWRTKERDELAEQMLQLDPHSPAECRTNAIARNVDLFYQAFDVRPEDRMWLDPSKRVSIW